MVTRCVAIAALSGFAISSQAQNFSLSLVVSSTQVSEGASFTLSVYGNADQGTHILGGAFSLVTDSHLIDDIVWNPSDWSGFNTDGGYAGNGNYKEVIFGQLVIPPIFPPAPGSELGGLIGMFTVQLVSVGVGDIDFELVGGSPFALETIDNSSGETFRSSDRNLTLGTAYICCFPTPGGVSAFAFAGLALARRRRH